jgi:hypothetical protein
MMLIKPRSIGLINKTYGFGDFQSAIGGLSFFSLGKSPELLMETSQWPKITNALRENEVLDMGFAKPIGEVLIAGAAYALPSQVVTNSQVSLSMGEVNKTLQVIGDREKHCGFFSRVTKPRAFQQIPLSWGAAFGGPDIAENPLGCGSKQSTVMENKVKPLPNFYYPDDSIKPSRKPKIPAGFGALDITWPQRTKYQGTYDDDWLKNRHPGFPKDTDKRLFCAAPCDQQFEKFILPGTAYCIDGMHPSKKSIEGVLPKEYIRIVVQQKLGNEYQYLDIETHIDTVWFFPDVNLGVAIHRGTVPVNDIDGLDITQLLLAYETAGQMPKPLEHYKKTAC